MDDKISFYILSYSGKTVKQLAIKRRHLGIIVTCVIFILVVTAGIFFDYFNLKLTFNKKEIEHKIANQSNEIISQRKQIQKFASEINTLKSNLVKLNTFEKKIRIIANIGKPSEEESLFGVGGSIPDNLDPELPLTEKQNRPSS